MQYQKPVIIQEQKLKMSPQMYQAIQLMALPMQDLKLKIREELEKNPALEVIEDKSTVSLDEARQKQSEENDYFENTSDTGFTRPIDKTASDAKQKFIEGALSRPESLQDHLLWQLHLQPIPKTHFETGALLIRNLDENGFHREDPERMVNEKNLKNLPKILSLIQSFEPVGSCTANYKESLLVQVKNDKEAPLRVKEIINDYLELLEKGKINNVAKKTNLPEKEVEDIFTYIKKLNPFPGRQYSTEKIKYVIPDLMVKLKDGEFILILNDEEIPVLGINPFIENVLKERENPKKELKQFVKSKIKDARWFIRSINQRNETLLKIALAIIEFQRDFFMHGPKYLNPLTLKDIAQEVSVHETTVSRISNEKYVQTEWGIYSLKYFFSNSISGSGSGGSRFSKAGVKEIIKEIIQENNKNKRLSDQKISEILKNRGINLARRTVSKYRNELDISSSYER